MAEKLAYSSDRYWQRRALAAAANAPVAHQGELFQQRAAQTAAQQNNPTVVVQLHQNRAPRPALTP
jgi:hypothetical protein